MISLISKIYSLFSGGGFLFKLVRNYSVLSKNCQAIETIINNMIIEDRKLPSQQDSVYLLTAISNILKTGVIDIPGVDEVNLAIGIDSISKNISMSIEDSVSGKFIEIPVIKKVKGE